MCSCSVLKCRVWGLIVHIFLGINARVAISKKALCLSAHILVAKIILHLWTRASICPQPCPVFLFLFSLHYFLLINFLSYITYFLEAFPSLCSHPSNTIDSNWCLNIDTFFPFYLAPELILIPTALRDLLLGWCLPQLELSMLPYRIEASVFLWHSDYLEFTVDSFNFIGKLLIINLISISSLHEIVLCFLQLEEESTCC